MPQHDEASARPQPDEPVMTDRIWTIPNILSMLRLAGVPVFLWLLLGPEADLWAAILLMVSGATDWLDGKIARAFGQTSKIGMVLDPAADRLYILSTLLAFGIRGILPWWVIGIIVLRDICVGLSLLRLRQAGYAALQVNYLGKAATFNLLSAFPLVLLAFALTSGAAVVLPIAYGFLIWGIALYVISGVHYIGQVLRIVRRSRAG